MTQEESLSTSHEANHSNLLVELTSNSVPTAQPTPVQPASINSEPQSCNYDQPLKEFDAAAFATFFPQPLRKGSSSSSNDSERPKKPISLEAEYLYPTLASNERLRLSTLWYHIRGLHEDAAAKQTIQGKVALVKDLIGWEYAICGLVDCDHFERIAAAGLPLITMPRRESPCSHTVLQPAGSVLFLPDLAQDWRFECSPCVSKFGLGAYAGAPLRVHTRGEDSVSMGSLCVASDTSQTLTEQQLGLLAKFADMLSDDIVVASRHRRMKQQEANDKLLAEAVAQLPSNLTESMVLTMLRAVFPDARVTITTHAHGAVRISSNGPTIKHWDEAICRVWEDNEYINHFIRARNHEKRNLADQPIRALVCALKAESSGRVLVVATKDISHIFDDIDVRFVNSCTMLLDNIAKEKSLQNALRAREQFMRGITHHLRTPIHGILASAELLEREVSRLDQKDDSSANGMISPMTSSVEMIRDSGKDLMRFVNSIIRFNHWADPMSVSQSAVLLDWNAFEMNMLKDIPAPVIRACVQHTCVLFDRKVPDNVALVVQDESLLIDCVQPLLLNAFQNTRGGSIVVTYSTTPDFTTVIFDIVDTGQGIPAEAQQLIFDTYEKSGHESQGPGLGLTISRKIAQSFDGSVDLVSSDVDKGSHFRATICRQSFACSRAMTPEALVQPWHDAMPRHYCVLQDGQPSGHTRSFIRLLQARGLTETSTVESTLTLVTYSHSSAEYQKWLSKAEGALVAFSLVPNQANISRAQADHPSILFFTCPFTTSRLEEILLNLNSTCEARKCQRRHGSTQLLPIRSVRREAFCRSSLALQGPNPQCLLVDDNLINLRILCIFCEQRKYPYHKALDGFEAIELYKSAVQVRPVALILLDLQMPNCGGIEACKTIRQFETSSNLEPAVIIIVTGQDTPSDRREAIEAGADDYFVKPIKMKKLDETITGYFSPHP